jgi:hypothetical protein
MNPQGNKRKPLLRRVFQLAIIILCLVGLWLWISPPDDLVSVPSEPNINNPPTDNPPPPHHEGPKDDVEKDPAPATSTMPATTHTTDIETPSEEDPPGVKEEKPKWWSEPVPEADILYFPPDSSSRDTTDNNYFLTFDPPQASESTDISLKCPSIKVPKVSKVKTKTKLPTIAYSIVVHKRPDLLRVWLYLTHDPDNFYMIHVDSKAPDDVYEDIVHLSREYTNVHINPDRYYTIYYGWSVMWNHISNYMRIKQLNQTRDYYINVSGMELPIQTRKEIRFFLGEHYPASFVREYCVISEVRNFWVAWTWAEVKAGLVVVNKEARAVPAGVKLHYGSQYSILHRNIVDWMLDDLRMIHLSYLRNTKSPEDIFFVTAARNSPYKNTVFIFNNMKYVEYNHCCTGFQTSRSTPCSLGVCDMDRINASVSLFLSRVDSVDDPDILQYVVDLLSEREKREVETKLVKRIPLVVGQTLEPTYAALH